MAVYTTLSESQVNELLGRFDLPALAKLAPVNSGIENTTYFVTLVSGARFVLTLFEHNPPERLPLYIALLQFLQQQQIPVACPLVDARGNSLHILSGKPAVLVPFITGHHCQQPDPGHCYALGLALARLHQACQRFPLHIPNPCGLVWAEDIIQRLGPHLPEDDKKLLSQQVAQAQALQREPLARGLIHGDLFRDNVLFDGLQLSAIIDFYNAGEDILLLDLAIAINDWGFDSAGQARHDCQEALLEGYQSLRPFDPSDTLNWSRILQWAATRFWLSRLEALYLSGPQRRLIQQKDPTEYKKRLLLHLGTPANDNRSH